MSNIRSIAAATIVIAAFATAPARACDTGDGPCQSAQTKESAAPLSLSQFLKRSFQTNPAPVAAKPQARASKPHTRVAAKRASRPAIAKGVAIPKAVPAPVVASQIEPMSSAGSETDGVAVASADDFNELDVAADTVRVVAANELNEIDLAAQAAAPSAAVTGAIETVSSLPQLPADISWAGELFAALGGMLAAAAATRLLIA